MTSKLFAGGLSLLFSTHLLAQPVVDVCIYGGTSAGVMAAVAAKRVGKSVMLIEPGKHLGGLTAGGLGATDIGNKFAITGLARNFYRRIGQHYGRLEQWTFEPRVAEKLFDTYLEEAGIVPQLAFRLRSVQKKGRQIGAIILEQASPKTRKPYPTKIIRARQFIDCTYEGDLMAMAGVSYTVGREANSLYGETANGVQLLDKHQFPTGVDPYNVPGKRASGLLWGISTDTLAPNGTGDRKVQAYNFRMCLTDDPANRIPIGRPARYDSTKYELLLRQIALHPAPELTWNLMHFVAMPNRKTDINNCGGLSTDMIGANWMYPEGSYAERERIIQAHVDYTKGFFYFIGHDPRIPKHLRDEMLRWGYPKDEYLDNEHFSHQLYIREARRMVGSYVMTEANCLGRRAVKDGVGLAAYTMDSHNCQRVVVADAIGRAVVRNEGDVQVGGFPPYPIAYGALVPKAAEVINLLVPVCLSASHIAYGSIRMEPVFMVLGQAAGMAAAQAIDQNVPVQQIDVGLLQKTLATNPLLNSSPPEQVIDNDDSIRVMRTGQWEMLTTGGHYGKNAFLSADSGAAVRFRTSTLQAGNYRIYLYNPTRRGGGGNPDTVPTQTDKSASTQIKITTNTRTNSLIINQQHANNDWIDLGTYLVNTGDETTVTLSTGSSALPVIADAVLFSPTNNK